MGALTLLPPGRGGPCADGCSHQVCQRHRQFSESACVVCRLSLGYGRPVYCYETRTGHVECIEEAVNRSLLSLLEGFAELAVRHHLKTDLGWDDRDADSFGSTFRTELQRSARTSPPRVLRSDVFLLPSHDLQCEIPSGRTKKPTIHIEDHTTLLATRKVVLPRSRTPQAADEDSTAASPSPSRRKAAKQQRHRPKS